jgi:hypothetical protein
MPTGVAANGTGRISADSSRPGEIAGSLDYRAFSALLERRRDGITCPISQLIRPLDQVIANAIQDCNGLKASLHGFRR